MIFFLIPQKESSLKNSPRGLIGRVLSLPCIIDFRFHHPYDICTYSPKERFFRTSPRGPIGRVLSLPCIIPQRRVPKNSLSGSHWFEWLSSPCLISYNFEPSLRPTMLGFIPRREMRSIFSRSSIVFTYVLIFGLRNLHDSFKTCLRRGLKA